MATAAAGCEVPMPLALNGRVAIVTGGSGGIGSAVATHLASLGAKVVIGYIGDPGPANHLVSTINAASSSEPQPQAIAVAADVSDAAQVKSLFDAAQLAFGPAIHILVTTAAVLDVSFPALADTTEEKWDWLFNTNAKGTFLCCREAANRLVRGGGGRIITFASSTQRVGFAAYAASKSSVEGMTRILARELGGAGITVNRVAPGPTATPMLLLGRTEDQLAAIAAEIPMGRVGRPEDIAPVVGFLATDAGEWVNGQIIRVNGGCYI